MQDEQATKALEEYVLKAALKYESEFNEYGSGLIYTEQHGVFSRIDRKGELSKMFSNIFGAFRFDSEQFLTFKYPARLAIALKGFIEYNLSDRFSYGNLRRKIIPYAYYFFSKAIESEKDNLANYYYRVELLDSYNEAMAFFMAYGNGFELDWMDVYTPPNDLFYSDSIFRLRLIEMIDLAKLCDTVDCPIRYQRLNEELNKELKNRPGLNYLEGWIDVAEHSHFGFLEYIERTMKEQMLKNP
ncbi:hypothetical protein GYB22_04470 [bacterium]|nr:hypothetical protein [bacterium]